MNYYPYFTKKDPKGTFKGVTKFLLFICVFVCLFFKVRYDLLDGHIVDKGASFRYLFD